MLFFKSIFNKRPAPRKTPLLRCFIALLMMALINLFTVGISPRVSMAQEQQRTQQIEEYELKAVYLYNFFHFVNWPKNPGQDGSNPKIIGVVGRSPFGGALQALQDKLKQTTNKIIKINFYGPFQEGVDLSGCHLLFISSSEKRNFSKITASLRGIPVLTVADANNFLQAGGMINMISQGNRVRWAINRTPVKDAGLRMDAKLLDIAVEIIEHP